MVEGATVTAVGTTLASFMGLPASDQPLADVLRVIRTHLGMEVAFISEFTPTERIFRHVDAGGDDHGVRVGHGGPLEESYCQRVADGRLPELIRDAATVPAAAELP